MKRMSLTTKENGTIVLAFLLLLCSLAWADESDLVWSTYLGGSDADGGLSIALDDSGNAYVTGYTWSDDFPTTAGVFGMSYYDIGDVFVVKLNAAGNALDYSTFVGGSYSESGFGVAVDEMGNVYVTGYTDSDDFPTSVGACDTTFNGERDVFVAKFEPKGSVLAYATFLGGSDADYGYGIAVDGGGSAYLTGPTESNNFPTTPGAFGTTYNGSYNEVFVAKLNPTGSSIDYATFLGGSNGWEEGYGIAVDGAGNAYVTGYTESADFPITRGVFDSTHNGSADIFVTRLNPTGSALDYATFLGGSAWEAASSIVLDDFDNAYLTGMTASADFPVTMGAFDPTDNGSYDGFIVKLDSMGCALIYSTFLGGDSEDWGCCITVDSAGNAYVIGDTKSVDFPITIGAFDTTYDGGPPDYKRDVFVAKLDETGSILNYATFLGGSDKDYGQGIAVTGFGDLYITGQTRSDNFPTKPNAFDTIHNGSTDVFVTKLNLSGGTPVASSTPLAKLPKAFALHQNYPNPFNAGTEIHYQISEASRVILKIFNTLGQEVRSLVNADQEAGEYFVIWDGRDGQEREVSSGLYFCRLQAADFGKTIKIVLVK